MELTPTLDISAVSSCSFEKQFVYCHFELIKYRQQPGISSRPITSPVFTHPVVSEPCHLCSETIHSSYMESVLEIPVGPRPTTFALDRQLIWLDSPAGRQLFWTIKIKIPRCTFPKHMNNTFFTNQRCIWHGRRLLFPQIYSHQNKHIMAAVDICACVK